MAKNEEKKFDDATAEAPKIAAPKQREVRRPSQASGPPSWHALDTGNAFVGPVRVRFAPTPEQARLTGSETRIYYSWRHAAAAQSHGWEEFVRGGFARPAPDLQPGDPGYSEPWVSRDDYLKALQAVGHPPARKRDPDGPPVSRRVIHEAAVPQPIRKLREAAPKARRAPRFLGG